MEKQKHTLCEQTMLHNRYRTGVILAESALCIVYRAYDPVLEQDVAVTEFFPRRIARRAADGICVEPIDPSSEESFVSGRESFLREAALFFGKYDYRGFPDVNDTFQENNTAYLVTEYLPGGNLCDYLEKQPNRRVSAEEAAEMMAPILEALSYLHSLGIVHGGICPERLVLDESGVCRLTGIGACGLRQSGEPDGPERDYAAPEQSDRRDLVGPWTDVYAVCAVLCEMLTGRRFRDLPSEAKKLRKLLMRAKVPAQITDAILQGQNHNIQQRYFHIGVLAKRISADSAEYDFAVGEIQARWGERWLETAEAFAESEEYGGRWPVTRRQIAHVCLMALYTAACCGLIAGGRALVQKLYPSQLLHAQIVREQTWGNAHPSETLTKASPDYDRILKYAKEHGEPDAYDNGMLYSLSANDMKKANIAENSDNKFGITNSTLRELLAETLDRSFSSPDSTSAPLNGVFLFDGNKGYLETYSTQTDTYTFLTDSYNTSFALEYDVTDGRMVSLRLSDIRRSECETVMKKVLPAIVPETFLTEEEIENLFRDAEDSGKTSKITHAKYNLRLSKYESILEEKNGDRWSLDITSSRSYRGMNLSKEPQSPCAGNYARGSVQYDKFMNFVKDSATETEKEGDTTIYHLTEAAVRKWGRPSNLNLLPLTDEELLTAMTDMGYNYTEEKKRDRFIVEESPYGILQTSFLKRRTYALSETLKFDLLSDIITGKIYEVGVYDTKNRFGPVAKISADLIDIISEDYESTVEEKRKDIRKALKSYRKETEAGEQLFTGGTLLDCSYMVLKGTSDDYYRFVILQYGYPTDLFSKNWPPYFWP